MTAPAAADTAGDAANPAVSVDHIARWLVALDHLHGDVQFGLPPRGVAQRLHDLADDMRATRHHARNIP